MQPLLKVVKKRRLDLGLKQHDLTPLVGMSRQQYQRLESKGNPRLNTLEQIAAGLKCSLLLVPEEKLKAVMKVLSKDTSKPVSVVIETLSEDAAIPTKKENVKKPTTKKKTQKEPVLQKPITEEPVLQKPITEEPVLQEPITEEPVLQEKGIKKPDNTTKKKKEPEEPPMQGSLF